MLFLTTDVFLAYLTESNTLRAETVRKLFITVRDGKKEITTSPIVLWELVTVLHNPHGFAQPKDRVASLLSQLLVLRGFRVKDKRLWLDTLMLCRNNHSTSSTHTTGRLPGSTSNQL
jgi:predicted nucleic acid-binding protein